MNKLWAFELDYGRNGCISGTFVATQKQIDKALGMRVDFGEALGKHSDVWCDLEMDQLTVLTDDQDFINKAIEYGLGGTGRNPLDNIYCQKCNNYMSGCECEDVVQE